MPPEKRRRGDADGGPAVPWDRSACHREEHPVNGPELRRTAGPLEDPELMAENEDLEILRAMVQATLAPWVANKLAHTCWGSLERRRGQNP